MDTFLNTYGFLIVTMLFSGCLALSLYLPLMAGQLSLASPAFYAIGGYVAAIFSTRIFPHTVIGQLLPLHYVVIEVLVAALISALVAIAIGLPTLRLRGIYLALATIALVEVVRILAVGLTDITNGSLGINEIPEPVKTISRLDYAYFALPLLIFSMWVTYRIERSRAGRAFAAIREDELAAGAMGINVTYYKVLAFVLGAMLAGVVGALSAHFYTNWNEKYGTFDVSVQVLAFVLVGGSRTFLGPVVGGMFLTALPEILRVFANLVSAGPTQVPAVIGPLSGLVVFPGWVNQFIADGRLVLYGVLLAAGTIFFPQGVITPDLYARFRRRKRPTTPVASVTPIAVDQRLRTLHIVSLGLALLILVSFVLLPWVKLGEYSGTGVGFLIEVTPLLRGGLLALLVVPIAGLLCVYLALRAIADSRRGAKTPRWLAISALIGLLYYLTYFTGNPQAAASTAAYLGVGYYLALIALVGLVLQYAVARYFARGEADV